MLVEIKLSSELEQRLGAFKTALLKEFKYHQGHGGDWHCCMNGKSKTVYSREYRRYYNVRNCTAEECSIWEDLLAYLYKIHPEFQQGKSEGIFCMYPKSTGAVLEIELPTGEWALCSFVTLPHVEEILRNNPEMMKSYC